MLGTLNLKDTNIDIPSFLIEDVMVWQNLKDEKIYLFLRDVLSRDCLGLPNFLFPWLFLCSCPLFLLP